MNDYIHGWDASKFVMALTTQEIPFSGRNKFNMKYFFTMEQQPYWAKAMVSSLSRVHYHTQLYTPHSVGLLWARDHPDTEAST
jgi:hypothetical protein